LILPISVPKAGTQPGTNPARLKPADAMAPVLKVATPRPRRPSGGATGLGSLVGAKMGDVHQLSRGFFMGYFMEYNQQLGICGVSKWGINVWSS